MKNLLVTGGAGFIGSNFIRYILNKYSRYRIVNLDSLTYAGNIHNLDDLKGNPNYFFVHGNILDQELVEYLVKKYNIDTIVNFAAESHVDRSIMDPHKFIETNIVGTSVLLEVTKRLHVAKFIQISTDEVYGSLGEQGYFDENSPLIPNSPYSASKASADLLVLSYYKTYGLNINITRCSNNYGPYQFPEKFIPLLITNGLANKFLPIYGDGENIRDWIYVYDHCQAIDLVLHKGKNGEIYNIGGINEHTNNDVAYRIVKKLKIDSKKIIYVKDRLGHDRRYAIDSTKIKSIGWRPQYTFEKGLSKTVQWYIDNRNWWQDNK